MTSEQIARAVAEELVPGKEWGHPLYSLAYQAAKQALDRRSPEPGAEQPANGVSLIAAERRRQITREGYDARHDDEHSNGEMVYSAVAYALHASGNPSVDGYWPFGSCEWKPTQDNPVLDLAKAGALIAAEIDRLLRREPLR